MRESMLIINFIQHCQLSKASCYQEDQVNKFCFFGSFGTTKYFKYFNDFQILLEYSVHILSDSFPNLFPKIGQFSNTIVNIGDKVDSLNGI